MNNLLRFDFFPPNHVITWEYKKARESSRLAGISERPNFMLTFSIFQTHKHCLGCDEGNLKNLCFSNAQEGKSLISYIFLVVESFQLHL